MARLSLWKRTVFNLSLFFIIFTLSVKAEENNLLLYFDEQQIEESYGCIIKGKPYLPLSFFSNLKAKVAFDQNNTEVKIQLSSLVVKLKVGDTLSYWNGKQEKLKSSPQKMGDEVWIPLEVADKLGINGRLEGKKLFLQWKKKYLLGVESIPSQEQVVYALKITGDVEYNSFLLEQPNRLVLDLNGVSLYPYLQIEDPPLAPVKGIRVSRFDQDKVRVVFDLDLLVGYKLKSIPGETRELQIALNAVLKDVGFRSAAKDPEIYIDTSHPVNYKTDYILNPHRLIVDLWDLTLTGQAFTIPGNEEWVKSIRVSQFDSQTIRLVVDIKEPRNCIITSDSEVRNRLLIKTIQELVTASWTNKGKGGELLLKSSGEIKAETFLEENGLLVVNLHHMMVRNPELLQSKEDSVFRLVEQEPAIIRVEVRVPKQHQYNIILSKDRSSMKITIEDAPLSGKVILIDPGHGGADAGAIGRHGLREKDLNLDVSLRLKGYLEKLGAQVLLTRDDDRYLWLYDRVAIANRVGAATMISIHANNHDNRKITGFEIWHHPKRKESALLADYLAKEVISNTGLKFRGIMADKDFVLPREAEMPSVIVEMGFISNTEEEKLLNTPEFRDKMAASLCQGLLNYFEAQAKDKK